MVRDKKHVREFVKKVNASILYIKPLHVVWTVVSKVKLPSQLLKDYVTSGSTMKIISVYGSWGNWSRCDCQISQKSRNRVCLDEPCLESLTEQSDCTAGYYLNQ